MSDDHVKEIFFEASRRTSRERSSYLDRACAGNATLRRRVEALLDADAAAGEFMAGPTLDGGTADFSPLLGGAEGAPASEVPGEGPGDVIGRYRLERRIGEGGFGTVYLAQQLRPIQRAVALKVVKAGMDTRQVIARFEAERQALALMDHPGIARVLDAGATDSGRPYFVMEYVQGEPLTACCDRHHMGVRDRLVLFAKVCDAVQHAHQKGVIHRDIKPTNVLVAMVNGRPTPKVIDFGVARATHTKITDHTLTVDRQMIGTPAYMSPEQASTGSGDIDTRTDVYALGALLYELLTGHPPFDEKRLRGIPLRELERIIREDDPPKPSQRAQRPTPDGRDQAARRRLSPPRLASALRGELDWIVGRAMEKDRTRRYPTAYALGADVRRHLRGEAVEAGPPSRVYRISRFGRRHRVGVLAATTVLLALVGGLTLALIGFARASEQRDAEREALEDAEYVTAFLTRVIGSVDPGERGRNVRVADLLDDAAVDLEQATDVRPEIRAKIHMTISNAYWGLGSWDQAEHHARRVLALREEAFGRENPQTAQSMANLAGLLLDQRRVDEALALSTEAVAVLERTIGPQDSTTVGAMGNHALMLVDTGRLDEAIRIQRRVVDLEQIIHGDGHGRTVGAMHNLASTLRALGHVDEAEAMLADAIARAEASLGGLAPETLLLRGTYAAHLQERGRFSQGLAEQVELLERHRELYGDTHPRTLKVVYNTGSALSQAGRRAEALGHHLTVLRRVPDVLPYHHPVAIAATYGASYNILVGGSVEPGEAALLVSIIEEIDDLVELAPQNANVFANLLAKVEPAEHRRPDRALRMLTTVIERAEQAGDPGLFGYLDSLGVVHAASGRLAEAIAAVERALELCPEDDQASRREIERNLERFRRAAGLEEGEI